ncbi:MAG: hypothetical protein V4724_27995 [Pseudomonadota bacterium]
MIQKIGTEVLYSPITYSFANEADADGFLRCVKGPGGRPAVCAAQWRCIAQARKERGTQALQDDNAAALHGLDRLKSLQSI